MTFSFVWTCVANLFEGIAYALAKDWLPAAGWGAIQAVQDNDYINLLLRLFNNSKLEQGIPHAHSLESYLSWMAAISSGEQEDSDPGLPAYLSSLEVMGGTLSPAFEPGITEYKHFFTDVDLRIGMSRNTAYAKAQGADDLNGYGFWGLRSSGVDAPELIFLYTYWGSVYCGYVDDNSIGVRPAIWLDLTHDNMGARLDEAADQPKEITEPMESIALNLDALRKILNMNIGDAMEYLEILSPGGTISDSSEYDDPGCDLLSYYNPSLDITLDNTELWVWDNYRSTDVEDSYQYPVWQINCGKTVDLAGTNASMSYTEVFNILGPSQVDTDGYNWDPYTGDDCYYAIYKFNELTVKFLFNPDTLMPFRVSVYLDNRVF